MPPLADKLSLQHRLFAQLSRMFGQEVPLYDKSLLVNKACNRCACDVLGELHRGFSITDDQLDHTSGERHGAIRIGTPEEYRWMARFFGCFAMAPHNFYDMTDLGSESQPIIATAFRSVLDPEHRVFTSLLTTDYFDPATRARIEAALAAREVFPPRAKELIEKSERQGGLNEDDAEALMREGVERIFKWTGKARDHRLYEDLCDAGFKIAADIACFESHHLNHLTPNTFCMDLYTAAMKFKLGELDEPTFRRRATTALARLAKSTDRDAMRLLFRHLTNDEIAAFKPGTVTAQGIDRHVDDLTRRLAAPALDLRSLRHAGAKEFTEGPPEDTPVLLRQDSYKALTEPVTFHEPDGRTVDASHTARFGEVEQRFYATTTLGRELYDRCLDAAEKERDEDPGLVKRDFPAYEAMCAKHFAPFPKTLRALLDKKLVFGRFAPTAEGLAAAGRNDIPTTDMLELLRLGLVRCDGVRYEDFLPVSAAGIFASNLNQHGTRSTAARKPTYTQKTLEDVMGKPIIDSTTVYRGLEAESMWNTYERLGLLERLTSAQRGELERAMAACPPGVVHRPARAAMATAV